MNETPSVRFDKWLWAVRLFKTRAQAADACRHGQVTIEGQPVKASRDVKIGEIIQARTPEITRTVKVLQLLDHRIGAGLVKDYAEDHTPVAAYEKRREVNSKTLFSRPKGAGRPTKKDRRAFDKFSDS